MKNTDPLLEFDRPIAFQRVFIEFGGVATALFLSQAIYWHKVSTRPGRWFYKTFQEWEMEIGLTRRELEKARKNLKELGILREVKKGIPAKIWYQIDAQTLRKLVNSANKKMQERYEKSLKKHPKNVHSTVSAEDITECTNRTSCDVQTVQTITEITTKTTPETTYPGADENMFVGSQVQAEPSVIDQEPTSGGENFDEPFAQPNERAGGGHEDFLSPEYFEGRHRELHGESWRFTSKDRRDLGELKSKYTPDEIKQKMDLLDRAIRLGYQCQDTYLARRKFSPGTLLHESITPRMLEMVQKKVRSKIHGQYEHTSEEEMIRQFNED